VPVFIGGPVHGGEDAGSVHRGPGAPAVIVPRYRTAFIACFFLVATAAYTWPLPLHPATHLLHPTTPINPFALADYYLNSWILSWVAHALRTDPLRLFEANVFYPCPHSLAFSEHILSGALLTLPLDVVHHDPILAQNVLLLASYVLGGIGTAIILCDLEASIPAALLGGSLFIFNPIRPNQIGHIQHMSSHWMPFALLFLTRLLRKGSWTTGAAFGGMLLLAELTTVYYTYYFGLTVVLFVVLHAAFRCRAVPNAYIRAIGIGAVVVLALAPTFLPFLQAREEFALARDPLVPQVYSASAITYFQSFLDPVSYVRRRYLEGQPPMSFLGIGTIGLAVLGLRSGRRIAWVYAGIALILGLVSLGPVMHLRPVLAPGLPGPHTILARLLPGFDALRVPARAAVCALLAVSVLAGLGADRLLRLRPPLPRAVALAVIGAVALADCWPPHLYAVPLAWTRSPPPVYGWLAAEPGDFPIVELPLGNAETDGLFMVMSTYHWKRLVNGASSFSPAGAYLQRVLQAFPDPTSLRLLHDLRVRYVVLHLPMLRPSARRCEASPELQVRYHGDDACVLEVLGAPPAPARAPDRPVPLDGVRATGSSGSEAAAVLDGDLSTHWTQAVDRTAPSWLQIDLGEPRELTRLVLRFGSHFGEYPRSYRVAVSPDGSHWTTVADEVVAPAPLVDLLDHPSDVRMEIPFPPSRTAHLRLVIPPGRDPEPLHLYENWEWWGVHELELREAAR